MSGGGGRWGASPVGEEAFAEFLARREAGEGLELEAFCADHPAVAGELRELWRQWSEIEAVFDAAADPHPVPAGDATELVPEGDSRYVLEGELGRGGMGVVHRVWDTHLERTLAMKVVRTSSQPGSRRLVRFIDEARITGRLGHPGIVPIHDVGVNEAGQVFFTMPLVEGHTLEEILAYARESSGDWSVPRVLGVLQRVCEAVGFAHARGVVHRDLKPSNVMVGRFGETYVLDWGLARVQDRPDAVALEEGALPEGGDALERGAGGTDFAVRTREGDVLGTPAYMPPEQAAGKQSELGPAADVYAVGAMVYQLLAGERPYDDQHSSSAQELIERVRSGPPRPLARLRPAPPAELIAICERAMQRDPERRYPDMSAVADDLRAFLEGRVVRAYEAGGWAEFKKWVGRNRALAASLGGLVLVAIAAMAAVAWVQSVEKAKVLRLSDFQLLSECSAEAETLWPPYPERVPAMDDWLSRAHQLLARLPAHEERSEEQQARAAAHPGGPAAFFDDAEERWQAEKLAELVAGLRGLEGLVGEVEQRRVTARSLEERTLVRPADAWRRASAESSTVGLPLTPQIGLVPLGPDPDSGLQEFAHVLSGDPPQRDAAGRLRIEVDTGIVLVLVPGGSYRIGADTASDSEAIDMEGPVHAVELDPFFVSKYEVTQAQWLRLTGSEPSGNAGATPLSPLRPVDNVSWLEGELALGHVGLRLPTEAQWEAVARAGTLDRWWTGNDEAALGRSEVIDGYGTLPVGSTGSPNPFGLFDVLGNVMEWCRDRYGEYATTDVAPGDGEREVAGEGPRAFRGGHCAAPPSETRVALRRYKSEGDRHVFIGLRPARVVDRP